MSRRIAAFFDVVKFNKWGSLAEYLRFQAWRHKIDRYIDRQTATTTLQLQLQLQLQMLQLRYTTLLLQQQLQLQLQIYDRTDPTLNDTNHTTLH